MSDVSNKRVRRLIKLFYDLEDVTSQEEKFKLLQKFPFQKLLKRLLVLMFDPLIKFEETSVFLKERERTKLLIISKAVRENADKKLKALLTILEQNARHDLRGEAFIKALTLIFNKITQDEFQIYCRILDRQLRVGITLEMVNQLYPNEITLPTKFMLPGEYKPNLELGFPVWCEPQIDGVRVKLVAPPKGKCFAYGRDYTNFTHLFPDHLVLLQEIAKKLNSVVELDGTLYKENWSKSLALALIGIDRFGRSEPATSSIYATPRKELTFYAFDFVTRAKPDLSLKKRKNRVMKFVSLLEKRKVLPRTEVIPHVEASSHKECIKYYRRSLKSRYKGIILKDPVSSYACCRSSYWLELSQLETQDAEIVSVILGTGLSSFKVAALLVKPREGSEIMVKNMADAHRSLFFEKRHDILGKIVELSWSKDSKTGEFVDPKVIKLRIDKQ